MEKKEFKSLKELMDEELQALDISDEYRTLDAFITDDAASAGFIRMMLRDDEYNIPDEKSELYQIAEARARHSAITFLMGLVFKKFGGIFNAIPSVISAAETNAQQAGKLAVRMWLLSSLYHDRGYFSEYVKRAGLDYRKEFKMYLFEDNYSEPQIDSLTDFSARYPKALAYTYEEILAYDQYAREYHAKNSDTEKVDHGILGGVLVFKDLIQKAVKTKSLSELPVIKTSALTIAQHNIYKSDSHERDKDYDKYPALSKLLFDSDFRIDVDTPLLLFLCLVDTLECVKNFSKKYNKESSLTSLTVLNAIKLFVGAKRIEIDLSDLQKTVEDKKSSVLNDAFARYREKGVLKLSEWTTFAVNKGGENKSIITIELQGVSGNSLLAKRDSKAMAGIGA